MENDNSTKDGSIFKLCKLCEQVPFVRSLPIPIHKYNVERTGSYSYYTCNSIHILYILKGEGKF